jgi:ElaB/YqjD/DUF883 family membrane-anchored ribosome-binding protein
MNTETADSFNTMSTTPGTASLNGTTGGNPQVQRVAQKAHEAVDSVAQTLASSTGKAHAAVDSVAQTLSSSTDKVMNWQQEYGEAAREQIRANPLAVVFGAFAVGYLFAKLTR